MREVLRGNVLFLTLGTVIRQLSLFITFPFFSLYVMALGGSMVEIGIVNALRPLAAMFIYPIAGALAENYGRVRILVLTGLLNAAFYSVYMLAPDWRFLAVANLINGLLVFRFPASSALLADSLDPGLRGRGFAAITAIPGFVGILSPYIGGYLTTVLGVERGMRLLYGVTIVALLLTALMNWRFLEETLRKPPGSREDLPRIVRGSYGSILEALRWLPRGLRFYALMIVLVLFFNSLTSPFWVVYATEVLGISNLDWGGILTLMTALQRGLPGRPPRLRAPRRGQRLPHARGGRAHGRHDPRREEGDGHGRTRQGHAHDERQGRRGRRPGHGLRPLPACHSGLLAGRLHLRHKPSDALDSLGPRPHGERGPGGLLSEAE